MPACTSVSIRLAGILKQVWPMALVAGASLSHDALELRNVRDEARMPYEA